MNIEKLVTILSNDFDEKYGYRHLDDHSQFFELTNEDGEMVIVLFKPEIIEEQLFEYFYKYYRHAKGNMVNLKSDIQQDIDKMLPELYGTLINNIRCEP